MTGELWIKTSEVIEAIFDSFYYNRSIYHILDLCEEIIARVNDNSVVEWTDDGDIIYGILVLLYGDYGTSPRSGWITKDKENIISCINDIIRNSGIEYTLKPEDL